MLEVRPGIAIPRLSLHWERQPSPGRPDPVEDGLRHTDHGPSWTGRPDGQSSHA
jgi:hypothetical protein